METAGGRRARRRAAARRTTGPRAPPRRSVRGSASCCRWRQPPLEDSQNPQRVRHTGGEQGRAIADGEDAMDRPILRCSPDGLDRRVRVVEAHRDRVVTPRIVETVTPIGCKHQLDPGARRRVSERAQLISGGRRKNEHSSQQKPSQLYRIAQAGDHRTGIYAATPPGGASVPARAVRLPQTLNKQTRSNQSQLLCGGLRSTIPRFIEVRDRRTRAGAPIAPCRRRHAQHARTRVPDLPEHVGP